MPRLNMGFSIDGICWNEEAMMHCKRIHGCLVLDLLFTLDAKTKHWLVQISRRQAKDTSTSYVTEHDYGVGWGRGFRKYQCTHNKSEFQLKLGQNLHTHKNSVKLNIYQVTFATSIGIHLSWQHYTKQRITTNWDLRGNLRLKEIAINDTCAPFF